VTADFLRQPPVFQLRLRVCHERTLPGFRKKFTTEEQELFHSPSPSIRLITSEQAAHSGNNSDLRAFLVGSSQDSWSVGWRLTHCKTRLSDDIEILHNP